MLSRKVWLVTRREYVYNFRRPSFLFTAFGVPLITLLAMAVVFLITARSEENLDDFQRVGYIDRAMIVNPAVGNPSGYFPITDPTVPMPVETSRGKLIGEYFDGLEAYAQQQLQEGGLDAYFVIPQNYLFSGRVDLYVRRSMPEALRSNIEDFMRAQIASRAPDTLPVPVARLATQEFVIRDLDSGEELSEAAILGRIILPFLFVMVYFMSTSTTAQFLMSGVVEEKENRLMEILATSVRPAELLWGKLLGLGALSLTQVALWAMAAIAIRQINDDARAFFSGMEIDPAHLALIGVLFLINFLLFAATMLGIGASVTAEAESRQIAGFFTFINVLPIMFVGMFFSNPDGALPIFFSFFPLTAAVGLTLRIGLLGGVAVWQIALSLALQVLAVLGVMWLAVRVFRLGMLMYGKPLTPRTLWRALREGRTTLTTVPVESPPAAKAARRRKGLFRR
ncbi:MAG: ABC transporter permease [Anaerolineae bacterium]